MFMEVLAQNLQNKIAHKKLNKWKKYGGHEGKTKFVQVETQNLDYDNDSNKYSQLVKLHEAMEWSDSCPDSNLKSKRLSEAMDWSTSGEQGYKIYNRSDIVKQLVKIVFFWQHGLGRQCANKQKVKKVNIQSFWHKKISGLS